MSSPEAPVRCADCGARIFFARSHATGDMTPLDAAGVASDVPGALALVGLSAFTRLDLIDHLVARGRVNESPDDFPHYTSHRATCTRAGDRESRSTQ